MSVITLLTDFGTADGYVAQVKGILLSQAPGIQLVDLAHDIAPGDVAAAAWAVARAWRRFPAGTVHLTVVDPGVGTSRRALAVSAGGQYFVGPDNGLLTDVFDERGHAVVALRSVPTAAPTFHARDVFAPAAAKLARGGQLATLGVRLADPVRLPRPPLQRRGVNVVGQVVHVDRFGTLVTNLPADRLAGDAHARLGVYDLPVRQTFADVPPGAPVAFIGSARTLEIAVRDGRADELLGLTRGAEVRATARKREGPLARESRSG